MTSATRGATGTLQRRTVHVGNRGASYAVGGRGLPVLFLHGWGLGHRSYRSALLGLMARGCRVYAPSLPGFAGTAELPRSRRTIAGYAEWVAEFLDAVDVDEPVLVVGHSFGGGVGIRLAHDEPDRVRHLVLINSIGSPSGSGGPALAERPPDRPMWQSGAAMMREVMLSRDGHRIIQAMGDDV